MPHLARQQAVVVALGRFVFVFPHVKLVIQEAELNIHEVITLYSEIKPMYI